VSSRSPATVGATFFVDIDIADAANLVSFQFDLKFDPAIDTTEMIKEIGARMREELDYAREAKNVALYRDMLADELIGLSFHQLPGDCIDATGERSFWGCWFDVARINDHVEGRAPLSLIASRAPIFVVPGILSLISFPGLNHERIVNAYAADVNAQLGGVRVFRNPNQTKPALAIFGPQAFYDVTVSIAVWAPSCEVLDYHYALALRIVSKVKRTAFDGLVREVVEIQLALDDRGVIRLGVVWRNTPRRF
jgi:hypothetical protein